MCPIADVTSARPINTTSIQSLSSGLDDLFRKRGTPLRGATVATLILFSDIDMGIMNSMRLRQRRGSWEHRELSAE